MGFFGKILGTALDVMTAPIALAKDVIPGCGGYIDGNHSKTSEKIEQVSDDLKKVRRDIEEL